MNSRTDRAVRERLARQGRLVRLYPSPNFNSRPSGVHVDTLVIHYTALELADSLEILSDRKSGVSTHFVIDRDGTVYQLVSLENRAWHAGVSQLNDRPDVNSFSVGIDLVFVPGRDESYPRAQWDAMLDLVDALVETFSIQPEGVVGHEHVALPPGRKQDPGPLFDWAALRRHMEARAASQAGQPHVVLPATSNCDSEP